MTTEFKVAALLIFMLGILAWGVPTGCSKVFTTDNGFYGEAR